MLGAGPRYTTGFEAADLRALHRLHLRAVDRRPRRRRHQGRRRQVPGRAGGLRRLPGRGRLPRSGQRQRRHPRRRRPLPERARGPRRRSGRGRLPRGQRRRPRRRRHPRLEGQVPRRSRGPRRLPGRGRLPRPGQRQRRHPRQDGPVPERSGGQGRLRGRRTAAPIRTTTRTASPTCSRQVPERAGDLQRLRGRGRLPRQGQRHHPGQQHHHPREDQVQDGPRRDPAGVEQDPRRGRDDAHRTTPSSRSSRSRATPTSARATSTTCRLTQDRVELGHARRSSQRGVDRVDACAARATASTAREDPGHNEAAWEKNRRVEFKIVKTKDGPTGVELGCTNATAHGVHRSPSRPDPAARLEKREQDGRRRSGREEEETWVRARNPSSRLPQIFESSCCSLSLLESASGVALLDRADALLSCCALQMPLSMRTSSCDPWPPKMRGSSSARAPALSPASESALACWNTFASSGARCASAGRRGRRRATVAVCVGATFVCEVSGGGRPRSSESGQSRSSPLRARRASRSRCCAACCGTASSPVHRVEQRRFFVEVESPCRPLRALVGPARLDVLVVARLAQGRRLRRSSR